MTVVDLMRHGETVRPEILAGRTDTALSALGWQQIERQTAGMTWDAIVSSPLRRAREAGERLSRERGLALEIDPGWREIDLGEWDGRDLDELRRDPLAAAGLAEAYRDPTLIAPPNGETFAALSDRVHTSLERLAGRDQSILVIAHAGSIRTALSLACNIGMAALWALRIAHGTRVRLNMGQREGFGLWGEIVEIRQP